MFKAIVVILFVILITSFAMYGIADVVFKVLSKFSNKDDE